MSDNDELAVLLAGMICKPARPMPAPTDDAARDMAELARAATVSDAALLAAMQRISDRQSLEHLEPERK